MFSRPLPRATPFWTPATILLTAGLACGLAGCSSPLAVQGERELQRSVLTSLSREIAEAQQYPEVKAPDPGPGIEVLQLKPELVPELERMAGPDSYDVRALSGSIGDDLLGKPQQVVPISLETAVRAAVEYNLQVQFARLQPAIAESQVIAAEAAFDWVLGNTSEFNNLDQPRAQTRVGSSTTGQPAEQRQQFTNSTSLRRALPSGGAFTFQQDLTYSDLQTPGVSGVPSPADEVGLTLRFDQPLLQNFGSDVNLAQVRLARNAERDAITQLKRDLNRTITDTERAYWQLVRAQFDVLILQRLYERGVETRNQVIAREILDATPAQIAQARATVEQRSSDLIIAQQALRDASDTLKTLMNLPTVTVGDEALILPVDAPVTAPIAFSLVDVLTTSVRNRPEVGQAILSIDNTSIRQLVADNARLPRLDLRLQARAAGLDDNFEEAYGDVADGDFIDYLVGFTFEQRLGNRLGESQYRQRRLERMQATIAYRNTVQQVVLEAKRSLRGVLTNFRLIGQTRVARYAAAESLRSFQIEKILLVGSSVQILDLEFRQQETLAIAEREEVAALADYNSSLAQLFQAMGTSLERNNILFVVPNAGDPLLNGGVETRANPVVDLGKDTYLAPPVQPFRRPWRAEPATPQPAAIPPALIPVPPPTVMPPPPRMPPPGPNTPPGGTPPPRSVNPSPPPQADSPAQ